mmetsp:Transcript_16547/g.51122  ORF Transcript_16547/g.51122 Transcript_16547/m.51122 type:complete len:233 (-) Transcript_16547:282-980(-)
MCRSTPQKAVSSVWEWRAMFSSLRTQTRFRVCSCESIARACFLMWLITRANLSIWQSRPLLCLGEVQVQGTGMVSQMETCWFTPKMQSQKVFSSSSSVYMWANSSIFPDACEQMALTRSRKLLPHQCDIRVSGSRGPPGSRSAKQHILSLVSGTTMLKTTSAVLVLGLILPSVWAKRSTNCSSCRSEKPLEKSRWATSSSVVGSGAPAAVAEAAAAPEAAGALEGGAAGRGP